MKGIAAQVTLLALTILISSPVSANTAAEVPLRVGVVRLGLVKQHVAEFAAYEQTQSQASETMRHEVAASQAEVQRMQQQKVPQAQIQKYVAERQQKLRAQNDVLNNLVQTQLVKANRALNTLLNVVGKEHNIDLIVDTEAGFPTNNKLDYKTEDVTNYCLSKLGINTPVPLATARPPQAMPVATAAKKQTATAPAPGATQPIAARPTAQLR